MSSRSNRPRRRRARAPASQAGARRNAAAERDSRTEDRRRRRESAEPPDGHVAVGRIAGAWGIRGHVKIQPFTDSAERFAPGAEVYLDDGETAVEIESARPHRAGLVARLGGVSDRNAAESLAGALLTVPEDSLEALPEGVYYHFQLIGMAVSAEDGEALGEIAEILETPGNDVYVVRKEGARDLLIPALKEVALEIDVPAARMTVRLPPGLR